MLRGEPVDRLPCMPITMMFAADRIGARYIDYSTDYRVQVEGQLRVADEFGFDYVNTMSDPAVEAADCGATLAWFDNQPCAIVEEQALLADSATLLKLPSPDTIFGKRMENRVAAIAEFKKRLAGEKLIEGWVEGPCAEAADLRGINTMMLDFYDDPNFIRDLFDYLVTLAISFAKKQVDAGADQIGIGDAAASLVGPTVYEEFVWPYEKRLVDAIHEMGATVRLHICGDTRRSLKEIGTLGCDLVDVDFLVPFYSARNQMGPNQVLAGNLDPVRVIRNGTTADVHVALSACRREATPKYIVAAGCELCRDTPLDNVRALSEFAAMFTH